MKRKRKRKMQKKERMKVRVKDFYVEEELEANEGRRLSFSENVVLSFYLSAFITVAAIFIFSPYLGVEYFPLYILLSLSIIIAGNVSYLISSRRD